MLKLHNLTKKYTIKKNLLGQSKKSFYAVDGVNLAFPLNRTTGIVGESGSGKSTLAKLLVGLISPTQGHFEYGNMLSNTMKSTDWKHYRKEVQMVFQDPYGSLNPRMKIQKILEEPLIIHKNDLLLSTQQRKSMVKEALASVGLGPEAMEKFPHEFSGGQRQRIGIARALILKPKVIILDEPISALDVSIQAQVMNLLHEIKEKYGITYLFIAHDLGVVGHISDVIAVMYFGKIVEFGETKKIFSKPRHPYTKMLLDAMPRIGKKIDVAKSIKGELPSPSEWIDGCPFMGRCNYKIEECENSYPDRTTEKGDSFFHCFNPIK
ncbi:MAG: oligopeptide/dipeptide ABC transporter ATP-binding protein [Leptospirales bacterium]